MRWGGCCWRLHLGGGETRRRGGGGRRRRTRRGGGGGSQAILFSRCEVIFLLTMSFRHSLSHQEMRRPLGHSMSLPVGGVRRKMVEEDSRRVRGRHSVPGANNVNQPSHHPSQPLPQNSKQKLQRSNAAQTGPVRPTRCAVNRFRSFNPITLISEQKMTPTTVTGHLRLTTAS